MFPRTNWKLDDGRTIELITPDEFATLDDGTELVCINEKSYFKGKDYIDGDTRGGFLAFGFLTFEDWMKRNHKKWVEG